MYARLLRPLMAAACLSVFSIPAFAGEVDDFQRSWAYRAARQQAPLDASAPLRHSSFVATHNSYNARPYANLTRYVDPNQKLTIYDQLRAGVRGIELDVHSYANMLKWFQRDLLLCHGQDNHLGCSTTDRPFEDGLKEVRRWLDDTRNAPEVLFIYIEDHMDSRDYGKAVNLLNSYIGNDLYRPASGACQGIPMHISKADILRSGKRVVMLTDGCKNAGFNALVHGGIGDHVSGYPTDSQNSYAGFPTCRSAEYSAEQYDRWMIRFNEDSTVITELFGERKKAITADLLENLQRCGANVLGLDQLTTTDGRLERSVWSWAANEPNNWSGVEHCAMHWSNGRFNDADCGNHYRYACKQVGGSGWRISSGSGAWSGGAMACASETNGQYRFAVPYSPQDNEALKAAKSLAGVADAWLNYTDQGSEGNWRLGN